MIDPRRYEFIDRLLLAALFGAAIGTLVALYLR